MSSQNASIAISISDDAMSASISDAVYSLDGGAQLTLESIRKAVAEANIQVPLISGIEQKIILAMQNGKDVNGVVIARGKNPVQAIDATLSPNGDLELPVFPGDPFGTIIPPSDAVDGQTVTGQVVAAPGKRQGSNITFPPDANCSLDSSTLQVRAEQYGVAFFANLQLKVLPLLSISSDQMRVDTTVYSADYRGRIITADRMLEALAQQNIQAPLDTSTLAAAINESLETRKPIPNVPIARGTEASDGTDGWFELYVTDDRSAVGTEDQSGRMDFRSRGSIRSVKEGDVLGKLHAPTHGIPGKDIFGRIIPAHNGAAFPLQRGENIEATEVGSEFTALISGMVLFARNQLSVTEVFQTGGDVDMTIGNLELEKGSVHVRGSVLSGFAIDCPANVLVDEAVESASISAGGNVEVKGGIIMDRGGQITSGGDISAMFAKGATIESQRSVTIAHEASNCIIFAKEDVIATKGRGVIVGSTVRCGRTIVANEIGSELGVTTSIFLGLQQDSTLDYSARKLELDALLQKIGDSLGTGDPREILIRTPKEQRDAVAKLLRLRLSAEKELLIMERETVKEAEIIRQSQQARLKVIKTIHPGTIIHCYGSIHKVKTPIVHSQVYYNPDERGISITSL